MASPHKIQCTWCKRAHRPPGGANCKYAKAAREHCAQLGMREEDYMLYLSDVSEDPEDPYEMTGETPSPCLIEEVHVSRENQSEIGLMTKDTKEDIKHEVRGELVFLREQLAALQSLVTEVISKHDKKCQHDKTIQEIKEIKCKVPSLSLRINKLQSLTTAKYLVVSGSSTIASSSKLGTNQEDDVHQLACHLDNRQDNCPGDSDQKKRSLHCGKVCDEGYGSFMPSTSAATVSGVPVSSLNLMSPNANEGQITDTIKGHSNATKQHVNDTNKRVQASIEVDQRGGVFLAAQDVQIRETERQNHHVSDTPASESEFYEGTRQDRHCTGEKEEVEARGFVEEDRFNITISEMGEFVDVDVLGDQSLGCAEQQLKRVNRETNVRQVGEGETQEPKICEVQGKEAGILVLNREHCHKTELAFSPDNNDSPCSAKVKTSEGSDVMTEESKMTNDMPAQTTTDQRNSMLTSVYSDLVCQIPKFDNQVDQPEVTSESNEHIQFNKILTEERETSTTFDNKATDGATKSAENQVSKYCLFCQKLK